MCALFRNRYKIESARLKGCDYCRDGAYFITICTRKFLPHFGEIYSGLITLSESGKIAGKFWTEIPIHFPFIELDEFIIMPDHIHGIIIIRHSNINPGHPIVLEIQIICSLLSCFD
jgi:putative transposase